MNYVQYLRQYVGHSPILTAGTGLLIFNKNKEILLQLRSDTNNWGVPGGSMELGETFEDTAKRELEEETGLICTKLKMVDILSGKETYRKYPNGDELYDITGIFEVRKYTGILNTDNSETKKLRFFSLNNLPQLSSMTETILKKVWNIYNK